AALEGRGLAERSMGMWQACIATFRRLLELLSDPVARAEARQVISFALHHTFDTATALAEALAGLAELGPGPDVDIDKAVVRLELQHQLALLWFLRGRFADVLALGNSMVETASALQLPRWLGWAQHVVAWAHTGSGRSLQAIDQYELVVATAEKGGDKLDIAADLTNLGIESYRAGRFGVAQANLERAVALYRELFSDFRAVLAMQGLGWVQLAQAQPGQAQHYADLATALAEQANDRWLADCLLLSATLHALRAEWDPAIKCVDRAIEILQQVGHTAGTVDGLVQLGRLSEVRGARGRAIDLYQMALDTASQMDPAPCVVAAHR